ncbi:MAG: XRE family transcriptional regulator [Rubrivivax sp.]|nr:MAG: XRE family transcriptional regulator [Rubrivivax sp.]
MVTRNSAPPTKTDALDSSNAGVSQETIDQAVGRRIREARESRDWTQQVLCNRSKIVDPEQKGISRTTLIGYEAGTSRPGSREIRLLCEALSITPNHLIFGEEQPAVVVHPALDVRWPGKSDLARALDLALVLAALKGHERDALLSLALSLAGRRFGDARLAGLRSIGALALDKVEESLAEWSPQSFTDGKLSVSLEVLAEELASGATSNLGNKLKFNEDGEPIGGEWLYPDPESGKS